MVLLAPFWRALQHLINILESCAKGNGMICNVSKTVCMVLHQRLNKRLLLYVFHCFKLNTADLKYVNEYLAWSHNQQWWNRWQRYRTRGAWHVHTCEHLGSYSVAVKTVLFKSLLYMFYGMKLWKYYTVSAVNRLRSSYIGCMKTFLLYERLSAFGLSNNKWRWWV